MPKVLSALTARTQFGQIMERATKKDERFLVSRRGEPQVVIMSVKDYINTIAPAPAFLREIQAEAKRKGLDKLSMREIDAVIGEVRQEERKKKEKTRR